MVVVLPKQNQGVLHFQVGDLVIKRDHLRVDHGREDGGLLPDSRVEQLAVYELLDVDPPLDHEEQGLVEAVPELSLVGQDHQRLHERLDAEDRIPLESVVDGVEAHDVGLVHVDVLPAFITRSHGPVDRLVI